MNRLNRIPPAEGKLGVLLPGMGAVATTMMSGVFLARQGLAKPIGSLTQMGSLALSPNGKRGRRAPFREALPLAPLSQVTFGAWDIFPDNAYEAACTADVLDRRDLSLVRSELEAIRPMPGAFYPGYVKRLSGSHVKSAATKAEMVEKVCHDIRTFRAQQRVERLVAVWCGSTEVFQDVTDVHRTIAAFERGLAQNDPAISNSQIYAWACLREGVPFANGAPNLTLDFPAAVALAEELQVPIAGKDFKTGQTLLKTVLAPGLRARMLGLRGWYSTNILGNRDGAVLDDVDSFRSKEVSKLGVLESILDPEAHRDLYGEVCHRVRIDYYPPRGDQKEGWDNIDIFGWLNYPMQIKINFLCRDSILAAPVVLDLALLLDFAKRAGMRGPQDWLGFFFKSPMPPRGESFVEHDLFAQQARLEEALRPYVDEAASCPLAAAV